MAVNLTTNYSYALIEVLTFLMTPAFLGIMNRFVVSSNPKREVIL